MENSSFHNIHKGLWNKFIKHSLISGLFTLGTCSVLIFIKAGWPLLWFGFIAPGFIYGIAAKPGLSNFKEPGIFVIASTFIYIICFYIAMYDNGSMTPLTVMLASTTGAILLYICYYFLSVRNCSFFKSLPFFIAVGVVSVLPAAFCCYIGNSLSPMSITSKINLAGIFTVFPLWQVLFSIAISYTFKKTTLI